MPTVPCVVGLVATLAFAVTVFFGFVYDDTRFVVGNPGLESLDVLWRAFADPSVQTGDGTHAGLWRPLRTLSFALDRASFGGAAWGPHAVNALLHGLGAALVARLLLRVGCSAAGALIGGLLYALHPAQVESVAWISSRGDVLAAAFLWGALLATARPALAVPLGLAALLSKEQAVVWPVLVLLVERLTGGSWGRALRAALPAFVTTLLYLGVRHALLDVPLQEGGLGRVGPGESVGMVAHQLWTLVLPAGGWFDWQMPWPPRDAVAKVALVCLGLFPAALLVRRRTRFAAAWFLAALVPTLFVQYVVPMNIRTADRFLLCAVPALAGGVGALVTKFPRTVPSAGAVVLGFAALGASRLPDWRDDAALWSRTARAEPSHWRAHAWLGVAALGSGSTVDAVDHLSAAAEIAPGDAKTQWLLGQALQRHAGEVGADEESVDSDDVLALIGRARRAYGTAVLLYETEGRQEGRAGLGASAKLRLVDLTLALGDAPSARALLAGFLEQPSPNVPPALAELWRTDVLNLAAHVERYATEDEAADADSAAERARELAERLRVWGGVAR